MCYARWILFGTFAIASQNQVLAFVAPRGSGPAAWNPEKEAHIRRAFHAARPNFDGMRVWGCAAGDPNSYARDPAGGQPRIGVSDRRWKEVGL
jgi:hypothetical protein